MDDLATAGTDNQVVLDGGDAEIVRQLVAGVDRLCRRRQHLDDDDRICRGHRIGQRWRAAIHYGIRLVIRVLIDLDGDPVAQRLAVEAGGRDGAIERGPDPILDPDMLDPLGRHRDRLAVDPFVAAGLSLRPTAKLFAAQALRHSALLCGASYHIAARATS